MHDSWPAKEPSSRRLGCELVTTIGLRAEGDATLFMEHAGSCGHE